MKRVASLYLPNLSIDRLRRAELGPQPSAPAHPDGESPAWLPAARLPENAKERAKLLGLRERLQEEGAEGLRIEDCSCPRGGGWRPGARWARDERQAQINALPVHQRPPMRMLGRRSEAAEMPFRGAPADTRRSKRSSLSLSPNPERSLLVTTQRSGQRVLLAAVSPEAAVFGLRSGMALTQARLLVSRLDIRPADTEADAALLNRLAAFASHRWTPRAAISGPDGLWLDLGGVAHLFGGEQRMCERILRFCRKLGLNARIAVAATAGAAHALARFGRSDLSLCPSGSELDAIAGFPPEALRLSEAAVAAARRFGIETVGELIGMARGPVARRLGHDLLRRIDQALGRADEPIDPIVADEPAIAVLRLAEPILSAEAIEQILSDLVVMLTAQLERQGRAARRIDLVCERVDGVKQKLVVGTARASRDPQHLMHLLKMKIEKIEPGFGIEAMELIGQRCEPLAPQQIGSDDASGDLPELVDRIAGRIGSRHIFHCAAVESDVPERSVRRADPLGPVSEWPRQWPRPVRLLPRPEPVDKVIAELPDQPPLRFSWRGETHRVRKADGPERIHGEWWKRTSEVHAVRDYFQVEDEKGARFWLFRAGDGVDGRTGDLRWFMHGLFA